MAMRAGRLRRRRLHWRLPWARWLRERALCSRRRRLRLHRQQRSRKLEGRSAGRLRLEMQEEQYQYKDMEKEFFRQMPVRHMRECRHSRKL